MLPIMIQQDDIGLSTLLLTIVLCCLLSSLLRRPSQSQRINSEYDSWYVTSGIQESYQAIVKEVSDWRNKAASKRSKGMFSFLSRGKTSIFAVDQSRPPRLYRVRDEELGEISFELAEVEDGGTSIKSTYYYKAGALIQDLKAKMPVKVRGSSPRTCPQCGGEMLPDFKVCPYCGTKLR